MRKKRDAEWRMWKELVDKQVAKDDAAARRFLLIALAGGPLRTDSLRRLAAEEGLFWRSVLRAKRQLGVVNLSDKQGRPLGAWELPAPQSP